MAPGADRKPGPLQAGRIAAPAPKWGQFGPEKWGQFRPLTPLLLAECDDRARRRSERRIKAAALSRQKSLREFDFDANPNIDPAVIHTLATCEWAKKAQPLCLSNESFGGWTKTFTDPRLCTAIVDRLTFNGTIIEAGTDSYRLAHTRSKARKSAAT
ncbi:ATP-binding protein [Streptomyces sp. NPDC055506]